MMKKAVIILASVAALAVTSLSVPARPRLAHTGIGTIAVMRCIMTIVMATRCQRRATSTRPRNWGPFFHRVRHFGPVPVVPYQPAAW